MLASDQFHSSTTDNSASQSIRDMDKSGFATGLPGSGSTSAAHSGPNELNHAGRSDKHLSNHPTSTERGNAVTSDSRLNNAQPVHSQTSTLGDSSSVSAASSSHTPHSSEHVYNSSRTGAGFTRDHTGAHAGVGDKVIGTAEALVGKMTNNSKKVIEGQTRKSEGKEGVQAAKAEGAL
ncbi:hypothetical protein JCM3766R1_000499 [Sporobolomyces carnicolor]